MANKMYCPTCKKEVPVVARAFGVRICPVCRKIIASNIPMDKAL